MAFRASNIIPVNGYAKAKNLALHVKDYAQVESTRLQNNSVNADRILAIYHNLRRAKEELDLVKTVPGIVAHAREQEDDPTYDIGGEFNALIAAVQAVMTSIESTFPTDGSGYLLEKKLNAQGTYDFRQFTPAQTAPLRALLADISAGVI